MSVSLGSAVLRTARSKGRLPVSLGSAVTPRAQEAKTPKGAKTPIGSKTPTAGKTPTATKPPTEPNSPTSQKGAESPSSFGGSTPKDAKELWPAALMAEGPRRQPTGHRRESQCAGADNLPVLMGRVRPQAPKKTERHAHFEEVDEELLAMSCRDAVLARQRRIRGRTAPLCV